MMSSTLRDPQVSVRRFFRTVFALERGPAEQARLPWRQRTVDHFFGTAFAEEAPGRADASCGSRSAAPGEFFAEFNWD